jgi:parallel beta-helix repeat protein
MINRSSRILLAFGFLTALSVFAGFGFTSPSQQQALATPATTTTITISDDANGGDCRDAGGNWNPNRKQCILRSNIDGNIVIASNDITLNCANREITGEGGTGILLSGVSGVTVRNCNVSGFVWGILLVDGASNNLIMRNAAIDNIDGISAQLDTDDNVIRWNTVSNNFIGIFIRDADNNIIENNEANDNGFQGIRLRESSDNNVVRFNTAIGNDRDGFAILQSSINNEIVENESSNNAGYGFLDETEDSGTAGTANTYTDNGCSDNNLGGSSPTGLCSPQP